MTTLDVDESAFNPRWMRAWTYEALYYRRTWRASVSAAVAMPVLYLAALGLGVGHLVAQHSGGVDGMSYLDFIAPSLLATNALQMGQGESLYPVLAGMKWLRTYHAAATTPLTPADIFLGKLAWIATRAGATTALGVLIIYLFGATHTWWALALPLVGALIAVAFAAPFAAFAATAESDTPFTMIYRFTFVPMFLFSATFYPVSVYPGWMQPVVQFVPLYHGVALARACASGHAALGPVAAHVAVLGAMTALGIWWGRRTFRRRLVD